MLLLTTTISAATVPLPTSSCLVVLTALPLLNWRHIRVHARTLTCVIASESCTPARALAFNATFVNRSSNDLPAQPMPSRNTNIRTHCRILSFFTLMPAYRLDLARGRPHSLLPARTRSQPLVQERSGERCALPLGIDVRPRLGHGDGEISMAPRSIGATVIADGAGVPSTPHQALKPSIKTDPITLCK
ncbi:hypothetical protein BJ912DRAFT_1066219 [Pholiota molesta]|nr:hypothetical protein BJ912DRAFT_1066219 [Pholiota molesta]